MAGLLVKVGGAGWPLARAQELADAVRRFRARSGRPAVAWAESFGEFTGGSVGYLLATAFDEIWLQPSGDLGLTGVAIEVTFLATALERAGVQPEILQRHEYKNAADTVLRRSISAPHREAVSRLAASAMEQIVTAVAAARGLSPERVREVVDRAPVSAAVAHEAGLVDRLGYRDEVYAAVLGQAGAGAQLRYLARYARGGPSPLRRLRERRRPVIAVVDAIGQIAGGRSRRGGLRGPSIGSDTLAAALRGVARERPAALVLRVDSPGGSYVASDVVWREVGRVRAAGIPVVASMGDVAASGGYFIAMAADRIVAQPGTLTGSIGVFGGKVVIADLLDRFGVSRDAVAEGANAGMFSTRRGFTADERQLLEAWLDRVYADFTDKVAQARGLSADRVHELARGRVWTGADAHERGLVDSLGGLRTAVEMAASLASVDADRVRLRRLPSVSLVDRLRPARSSDDRRAAASASALSGLCGDGSVAGLAARLGLPAGGALLLPHQLRMV